MGPAGYSSYEYSSCLRVLILLESSTHQQRCSLQIFANLSFEGSSAQSDGTHLFLQSAHEQEYLLVNGKATLWCRVTLDDVSIQSSTDIQMYQMIQMPIQSRLALRKDPLTTMDDLFSRSGHPPAPSLNSSALQTRLPIGVTSPLQKRIFAKENHRHKRYCHRKSLPVNSARRVISTENLRDPVYTVTQLYDHGFLYAPYRLSTCQNYSAVNESHRHNDENRRRLQANFELSPHTVLHLRSAASLS